jgi:serine/threonine-protein kinase
MAILYALAGTIPSTIGPYEIRQRLGAGGMGSVYLGYDAPLQRLVAVKVLHESLTEANARARFTREAQLAGTLRHQNIVTVFGFGDDHGRPYIVMEYLPGETLGELIARGAAMPLSVKLHVVARLCDGLGHAHDKGVIHRDIKPANVVVDVDGTVKVLDFGVARRAESDLTQTGTVFGTLNYLSPEQLRGKTPDARSDIFAVGAVFYELVSGVRAFPGGIDDGVLAKILTDEPRSVRDICPDVPKDIDRCIVHALAKRPEDRYQTLGAMKADIVSALRRLQGRSPQVDLADELKALIVAKPFPADPGPVLQDPERESPKVRARESDANAATELATPVPPRRKRMLIPAAIGGAAVVGVAGWLWLRDGGTPPPTSTAAALVRTAPVAAASSSLAEGASPPSTATPPKAGADGLAPRGPDLARLVSQASSSYARGARDDALNQIQGALQLDARYAGAVSLIQTWLSTARADVRTRRTAAEGLGQDVKLLQAYRDGRLKEAEADWLAKTQPAAAIRSLWASASSYDAAATATRQRPTLPPPAATPSAPAVAPMSTPAANTAAILGTQGSTTLSPPPPVAPPPSSRPDSAAATPPAANSSPGQAPATPTSTGTAGPVIPQGARDALDRYAAAYSRQDLRAIKAVFPNLPSDREAALNRAFKSGCRSYDVRFNSLEPSRVTADSLTILATTTYTCYPSTGQSPRTVTADDFFQLKRAGNAWVIDKMQLM